MTTTATHCTCEPDHRCTCGFAELLSAIFFGEES